MIKEYNLEKGFLLSSSWKGAMADLSEAELGRVIRILMKYQESEGREIPRLEEMSVGERMFCLCVLPQIDNRLENAANGRKGGRPRNEENETEENETEENPPFQNESENKNPSFSREEFSENLKISKDKLSKDKSSQAESSSSSACTCACAPVRENGDEEDEDDETEKETRVMKEKTERDTAFAAFMAEYPKKYRVSEARQMFDDLGIFDTAELLDLLSRWKRCENWQKEGGRYIPSPDKFLREIYGFRLMPEEHSGSFDTDEFFAAALRRSYTEPMNGERTVSRGVDT